MSKPSSSFGGRRWLFVAFEVLTTNQHHSLAMGAVASPEVGGWFCGRLSGVG